MDGTTVKLSRAYTAHGKTFTSIRLREPTYKDIYMDGLGVPEEAQPTPGGGYMIVTNYDVIGQYVEKLAVDPGVECLTDLSAKDARALAKAVCGFFREAERGSNSETGSSSNSDSTQAA